MQVSGNALAYTPLMATCAACGTDNRPGRKFCSSCGAGLPVTCPNCGAENEAGERFCGECGTSLGGTGTPAGGAAANRPVAITAEAASGAAPAPLAPELERRVVSVLFADLVGSTAAAEGRDPEETREVLSRYFAVAREIVDRYGGTIEKFIGDAVMALWGAPVAHEDDAERAVRAALDLVDAVARIPVPDGRRALHLRAAVMTGETAVTLGARGEGMVAGDLVNTAARLQGVAEPGTVLVGEQTQRAARASICFEPIETPQLRGKSLPVAAWRAECVMAGLHGSRRDETLEPPFTGRDAEFALLKDLFHATSRERRLRIVSITGQAGIGKSRLAWELEKYLDGLVETVLWHQGRSPAYGEGVTFWALGEMVRRRAGITEGDDESALRRKLRETLDRYVPDEEDRRWVEPKLQALLGAGQTEGSDTAELFAAWRFFFERLAAESTVVLVFEDLHWADSGLIDFIEHLADWARTQPILIVTLARPELLERRSTWGAGRRNFTSMHLEPLEPDAMRRLLTGLVPGLPAAAIRAIVERAEGIPLFAVETIRMMLAQGVVAAEGARYRLVRALPELRIPETLHALIASRLDALPSEERSTLQDAAVLGVSFSMRALEAVAGRPGEALRPQLDALVRTELLQVDSDARSPGRGNYQFVQGVVREVAYSTLARRDRLTRHLAAARYFEHLGDDELAAVLASHFLDAYRAAPAGAVAEALAGQARVALRAAADRASHLNVPEQALTLLEQALIVTPDGSEQTALRERAGEAAVAAARYDRAEELLEAAIAWHRTAGAYVDAARPLVLLTSAFILQGRVTEARDRLEMAIEELGPDADGAAGPHLYGGLARAHFLSESPERALTLSERAIALAEHQDALEPLVDALVTKGSLLLYLRPREGRAILTGAIELADSYGFPSVGLRARNNLIVALESEDLVAVHRLEVDALRMSERLGNRGGVAVFTLGLAFDQLSSGEWDAAEATLASVDDFDLDPLRSADSISIRAQLAGARGDTTKEAELRQELAPILAGISNPQYAAMAHLSQAFTAAFRGDFEVAHREAIATTANPRSAFEGWRWAARAAVMLGDVRAAREAVEQMRASDRRGRIIDAVRAEAEAGLVALERSPAEARPLYGDILRTWRGVGIETELAMVQLQCVALLGMDAPEARTAADELRAFLVRNRAVPLLRYLDDLVARSTSRAHSEADRGHPRVESFERERARPRQGDPAL